LFHRRDSVSLPGVLTPRLGRHSGSGRHRFRSDRAALPSRWVLGGDARDTLRVLAAAALAQSDRRFVEQAPAGIANWWKAIEDRGTRRPPMYPQSCVEVWGVLCHRRGHRGRGHGNFATWFARQYQCVCGQMFALYRAPWPACQRTALTTPSPRTPYPERQVVPSWAIGGFSSADGRAGHRGQVPPADSRHRQNTTLVRSAGSIWCSWATEYGCDLQRSTSRIRPPAGATVFHHRRPSARWRATLAPGGSETPVLVIEAVGRPHTRPCRPSHPRARCTSPGHGRGEPGAMNIVRSVFVIMPASWFERHARV